MKPATGGTTPFSIPVLIGPKQDAAAPLTLTGTVTGLSVSPSTLDFGDIPEVQPSAPQTVTVTNPTGQALPLFVRRERVAEPGRDRGASADRLVQNRGGMSDREPGRRDCVRRSRVEPLRSGDRGQSETGHGRNNTFQHPGADRAQAGRRRAADVDRHGYGSVGVAVDPRFWGYPRSAVERAADGHGDEPDRSGAPAVRPRERVAEPGRDRGASR